MYYIKTDFSKVIPWETAFPDWEFGQHGKEKVGFGVGSNSADNPTSVCVEYNAGDRLLEVADFSDGSSGMGATMGGDRDIVIADKPFAMPDDTDCHILGVLQYRNGTQPELISDGAPMNRFSSFVSETGAPEEDPAPQERRDNTQPETYYVNRTTGHAAWGTYYAHIYRHDVNEGQEYAALTLEHSGHTPKTDTVYPEPPATGGVCPHCGETLD